MADEPQATTAPGAPNKASSPIIGNAFGAGLVLVVMPMCFSVFGVRWFSEHALFGLPLLAILGIMLLFGAMTITSSLFQSLGLADKNEALALPPGSVRAAIALSLVVLFATIAIMLFQTLAQDGAPKRLEGLSDEEKTLVLKQPGTRVMAVRKLPCTSAAASAPPPAPAAPACYDVEVAATPSSEAVDLAKQLLTLIGTLMTSVTSFYFAAKTAAPAAPKPDDDAAGKP
ncbi:MAG: hypothetical protein U1F53_05765 [Burkholderiaceae bacterium]